LGRRIHAKLGRAASRDREVVGDEYERATLSAVIVCHRSARRAARREAPAGEPVFRGVSDGAGKPRLTGYSACAGYDGFWRTTQRPHGDDGHKSRPPRANHVDSELTWPFLVAHQMSASSAFVVLWAGWASRRLVHAVHRLAAERIQAAIGMTSTAWPLRS
jgi:hypothetical protein